jgi:hypothetical protein
MFIFSGPVFFSFYTFLAVCKKLQKTTKILLHHCTTTPCLYTHGVVGAGIAGCTKHRLTPWCTRGAVVQLFFADSFCPKSFIF